MAKALDVIKYFLYLNYHITANEQKEDGEEYISIDPITHLKAQKLAYYAQGLHLAYYDKPLFKEEIQAWQHGPVVKDLYEELKQYEKQDLMLQESLTFDVHHQGLSPEEKGIIMMAFRQYGQYTASKLRNKTHEEIPWKEVYSPNQKLPITHESMKNFFKQEIKKEHQRIHECSEEFICLFQ